MNAGGTINTVIDCSVVPSVTPTPSPVTLYTYLGRTTPDAASSANACSSYSTIRGYLSLISSLASITVGDVFYDSYPGTPTNGGNNWIALKSGGVGDAYSFQINTGGSVIAVGGNCTPPTPTPSQTPSNTPPNTPCPSTSPTPTPTIPAGYTIDWGFSQNASSGDFSILVNGIQVVYTTVSNGGQITVPPGAYVQTGVGAGAQSSLTAQADLLVTDGATTLYNNSSQGYPNAGESFGPYYPSDNGTISATSYEF